MSTMTKELFRDFFGVPVVLRDFLYRFDVLIREGIDEKGSTFEVYQRGELIGMATTLDLAKEIVWTKCIASVTVEGNDDGTVTSQVASTLPAPPPPKDVNLDPEIEVADPVEVEAAYRAQGHDMVIMAGAEERVIR